MKLKFKNTKGITLVALIITIIVLLILAVVAITSISKSNILNHAKNVGTTYTEAEEKEKVTLAVHDAMLVGQGTISETAIASGMNAQFSNNGWEKISSDTDTMTVKIKASQRQYKITLSTGKIEVVSGEEAGGGETGKDDPTSDDEKFLTIQEAQSNDMLSKTINSKVKDENDNIIVVPAGFKITNDTEHVTKGIVITDGTEADGNEFVWIPVGTINKIGGGTETIELDRYTFADGTTADAKGTPIPQNDGVIDKLYQEVDQATADSTNSNMLVAKSISDFKISANNNHGYYIGRYEARNYNTDYTKLEKIKINRNYLIGGGIEQNEAASNCRSLYSGKPFISDLINSYAWDTAIVFAQKFDDRTDKSVPYSYQTSVNNTQTSSVQFAISFYGTAHNGKNEDAIEDEICNIFDMADSGVEWTTEYSSYSDGSNIYSRVVRGGLFNDNGKFSAKREKYKNELGDVSPFYRPILYITQ